jgi:tetratricopeptide (TPR) repeat protein
MVRWINSALGDLWRNGETMFNESSFGLKVRGVAGVRPTMVTARFTASQPIGRMLWLGGLLVCGSYLSLTPESLVAGDFSSAGLIALQDEQAGEKAEAATQDGTEDFEKATALKVNARRPLDFDRVVQLCESALEKGLDPASAEFCRRMMLDALLEYARQASSRILVPNPDTRWRFMRGESLKRLSRVVEIDPSNVEAWTLIAKLNVLESGDRDQGMDAISRLIDLSAEDKSQLAQALLLRAGYADSNEARLEDLNQAVEVDPKNLEARRARAMYFLLNAEDAKAIEDFQALLDVDPADVNNRLMLAEVLIRGDQVDRALELLEGTEAPEGDFRPDLLKAQVYFNKSDFEKCLEATDRVLKASADNIQAINFRILSLLQLDKNEEALSAAEDLVTRVPGLPQGYWLRSIALSSLDRFDDAIKDLRLLVDNVPDNLLFKLQLGNLYNASDRPRRALELYNEIFEEDAEFDGLFRSRGDAYLSIGQHAEAVADYEKELAKNPEDSGTLNNLSWVLSTSPRDDVRNGSRALELALKAAELSEFKAAHILSTLASAYAETGDFDKAREWITKAVSIAEENKADNLESLKKEAESYQKNEPWRELEVTEEKPLEESETPRPRRNRPRQERSEDDF